MYVTFKPDMFCKNLRDNDECKGKYILYVEIE